MRSKMYCRLRISVCMVIPRPADIDQIIKYERLSPYIQKIKNDTLNDWHMPTLPFANLISILTLGKPLSTNIMFVIVTTLNS